MYGALLTNASSIDGDLSVLFMHNEGYSTMCGHGIIALSTVLFQTKVFPSNKSELRIDTPAGHSLCATNLTYALNPKP